ncbi:MAG: hypothetical protein NT157_05705 [Candidatus Micrarchaeota archaeon]|nr:hypothetical protein [Candidatus Micrarchaeota archaeon]
MASDVYNYLNKAWKSTTKVLFGQEVGELRDFEEWLNEYVQPPRVEHSEAGDDVYLSIVDYSKKAKFIGLDQLDMGKTFEPLDINEIKDIDSIVEALQERFHYTGNVILGNSQFVEKSSNVVDSSFVYRSILVNDSKYIAYCDTTKMQEYSFGTYADAESQHAIKCTEGHRNRRYFECHTTYLSSDCYYSANLQSCADCMFSFGAEAKMHLVGNMELPKDKYLALKSKLVSEIADTLKKNKRVFSLLEIIEKSCDYPPEIKLEMRAKKEKLDKSVIESAFSKTTRLILGRELKNIDDYSKLLQKHSPKSEVLSLTSPLTGQRIFAAGYLSRVAEIYKIKGRLVGDEEIRKVGEFRLEPEAIGELKLDSDFLAKKLHPIAYLALDGKTGTLVNLIECAITQHSEDCYRGSPYVYSKKCGYCFWPRHSEHIFGSSAALNSSFCINSHYSKMLTRTFEVDSCEDSSDLYFSHNCENVRDSMFCFNVKNLNHSIGNAPLAQDKYKNIKQSFLEQIAGEIEKTKNLKWDVYNIGAGK